MYRSQWWRGDDRLLRVNPGLEAYGKSYGGVLMPGLMGSLNSRRCSAPAWGQDTGIAHLEPSMWEIQELQNEGCEPNQSTSHYHPAIQFHSSFTTYKRYSAITSFFLKIASNRAYIISLVPSCTLSTECSLLPSDPCGPPNNRVLSTLFRVEAGCMVHTSRCVSQPIKCILSLRKS